MFSYQFVAPLIVIFASLAKAAGGKLEAGSSNIVENVEETEFQTQLINDFTSVEFKDCDKLMEELKLALMKVAKIGSKDVFDATLDALLKHARSSLQEYGECSKQIYEKVAEEEKMIDWLEEMEEVEETSIDNNMQFYENIANQAFDFRYSSFRKGNFEILLQVCSAFDRPQMGGSTNALNAYLHLLRIGFDEDVVDVHQDPAIEILYRLNEICKNIYEDSFIEILLRQLFDTISTSGTYDKTGVSYMPLRARNRALEICKEMPSGTLGVLRERFSRALHQIAEDHLRICFEKFTSDTKELLLSALGRPKSDPAVQANNVANLLVERLREKLKGKKFKEMVASQYLHESPMILQLQEMVESGFIQNHIGPEFAAIVCQKIEGDEKIHDNDFLIHMILGEFHALAEFKIIDELESQLDKKNEITLAKFVILHNFCSLIDDDTLRENKRGRS